MKKVLSIFLTLSLVLTMLPATAFAGLTGGGNAQAADLIDLNQWLSSRASGNDNDLSGQTLPSGEYYLSGDLELDGTQGTATGNGLIIESNAYVKIHLNGYTLTAKGKIAESGANGEAGDNGSGNSNKDPKTTSTDVNAYGYAGIYLPQGATLLFEGSGKVEAYGGTGGNGGNGGAGGNASALAGLEDECSGGGGGAGGEGGGGAGAAIGTNGTASVKEGTAADPETAGTLLVYQDAESSITMNLYGGAAGINGQGGAGGKAANDDDWTSNGCGAAGGNGGSGGGNGGAGANYGSGGYGGVTGASGKSGERNTDRKDFQDGTNGADGTAGANAVEGTYTTYTLKKLTVESIYSAVYNGDADAEDDDTLKYTSADLTAPEALDVWAVYEGDDIAKTEKYWQLKDTLTVKDNSKKTFTRYTAEVDTTTSTAEKAVIKVTYVPMQDGRDEGSKLTGKTATTDVLLGIKTALDNNAVKEKDGVTAVTLGDAAKFNDGKLPLAFAKLTEEGNAIYGASWKLVNYAGKAYKFDDRVALGGELTDGVSLGSMPNNAYKTYSVSYKPYNKFTENGTTYNEGTDYKIVSENSRVDYAGLKNVDFKNAGLYTIKAYNNRPNVGAENLTDEATNKVTVYYIVIQQADLEIENAIDTVTNNTTVQDHSFDREVIGQNGESVLGEYVFPSNSETSRGDSYCKDENWGNRQNLSVNSKNPKVDKIEWEFNIKATYGDGTGEADNPNGDRNQNNYLDQNDGPSVSIAYTENGKNYTKGGIEISSENGLTAAKNTFYSGSNGVLLYDASGIAVIESDANLMVSVRHEKDQKFSENGEGADYGKTQWAGLDETTVQDGKLHYGGADAADAATNSIKSIFAENVAFGAEFYDKTAGFRVKKDDAVSGNISGGTPVSGIPTSISLKYAGAEENADATALSGASLYAKLVDNSAYKGDYYVVTITDKDNNLIKKWEYNDDSDTSEKTNVAKKSEYMTRYNAENAYDALQAGKYTVTVQYVGLYYTNNTPAEARTSAAWTGKESFNWVTASQSFTLEVEPRNVAYKQLTDINKVYDSTKLLVKDTMGSDTGDVESASGYVIDLTDGLDTATQFAKGLANSTSESLDKDVLYNYLQPTDGKYNNTTTPYHTKMQLEIAGTYPDKNAGCYSNNSISVTSSRLLDAGENGDYNNYNLISVSNQNLTGSIYTAQMYVTHDMTGSVTIRDYTPMRDVLNLHVKAYMPVTAGARGMDYATEGDNKGYLANAVTFQKIELVAKDDVSEHIDATKTAIIDDTYYPANSESDYDYNATFALVENTHSQSLIKTSEHPTGFAINGNTGAVTSVADKTSNTTDPARFPSITMTLDSFGNYLVVKQGEDAAKYPTTTYGQCTENTYANGPRNTTQYLNYYAARDGVNTNTGAASGTNTLTHTLRYKIVGNENTFDLILPINQLNNRTDRQDNRIANSTFINETGDSEIEVGSEVYKYVTLYENGDSAQFSFTAPQDSYLKDVLIVAVEKGTDGADITVDKSNLSAYADVDKTKTVGKFSAITENTEGKISTTYTVGGEEKDCVLKLQLTGVNDLTDFTNNDIYYSYTYNAEDNDVYGAYKLADANKQIGGSTYSFTLTTGKSDLGSNFNIMIVPVFEEYGDLIDNAAEDAYKANVSVEKTVDNATGVADSVYVNFKKLWTINNNSREPRYGEVVMSYGEVSTKKAIPNTDNDTYISILFDAEATDMAAKNFFNPATLIPGTEVTVTITAWRNGTVDNLQKDTSDDDAMDSVTFTWTVSQEDYYRLFEDDVIVFRSSNAKDDTNVATEMSNVTGYGIVASGSTAADTDLTKVTFVPNTAKATVSTEKNMLSSYGSEVYKVGETEKLTLSDNKVTDLALGDSLYLKKTSSSSGGSGGGGGSAVSAYGDIKIEPTTNGTVTAKNSNGTVTLTVTPDKGYTPEILTVVDENGKELALTKKSETEYTFKLSSADVTVTATFMEDNTMLNYFVDVNARDYYYDSVLWAAENGITTGTDSLHFSPDMDCTRAQIVTFLWRAAGSPESDYATGFTDVVSGSYYETAVAWAVENGVAKGTSDTTFEPDKICTRAQCVTFIARALDGKADTQSAFTDVARSAYYAEAVDWAAENKVTTGVSATLFAPDDNCTRAQIVTFLWRAMVK